MRSLLMLALAFGYSAFGADHFTCKAKENNQTVTVKFAIRNLATPKRATLLNLGHEESEPILVTPNTLKNGYRPTMTILNDQGGDLRMKDDRILLYGDGDGYTYVDLVLFKNTGYTHGYARAYGSGDTWYQKISCTRRTK